MNLHKKSGVSLLGGLAIAVATLGHTSAVRANVYATNIKLNGSLTGAGLNMYLLRYTRRGPRNELMFDDQIRFRLTSAQKRRLYAEAKRRHVAASDMLRDFIDTLPGPSPVKKTAKGKSR